MHSVKILSLQAISGKSPYSVQLYSVVRENKQQIKHWSGVLLISPDFKLIYIQRMKRKIADDALFC